MPDQLESLMSEKKLLQAALLLIRSQKTITNADLMDVGALTDLRLYLNGQETVSSLAWFSRTIEPTLVDRHFGIS